MPSEKGWEGVVGVPAGAFRFASEHGCMLASLSRDGVAQFHWTAIEQAAAMEMRGPADATAIAMAKLLLAAREQERTQVAARLAEARKAALEEAAVRVEGMRDWHSEKKDAAERMDLHEPYLRYHQRIVAFEDAIDAIRQRGRADQQGEG
ncbi:hypothetical protein [Roseomonas indoligenes]|uniref:Uncharacterized protein n=1 Tax=Roseomonas indoligenes TaxID=2820811 RepID=A0A940MRN9_9PROT|nr:hypothetical protein [Pararoseomonas indoligenes]MBP0492229.1 hypothetical protein [Pararoseomonas indoligenes]